MSRPWQVRGLADAQQIAVQEIGRKLVGRGRETFGSRLQGRRHRRLNPLCACPAAVVRARACARAALRNGCAPKHSGCVDAPGVPAAPRQLLRWNACPQHPFLFIGALVLALSDGAAWPPLGHSLCSPAPSLCQPPPGRGAAWPTWETPASSTPRCSAWRRPGRSPPPATSAAEGAACGLVRCACWETRSGALQPRNSCARAYRKHPKVATDPLPCTRATATVHAPPSALVQRAVGGRQRRPCAARARPSVANARGRVKGAVCARSAGGRARGAARAARGRAARLPEGGRRRASGQAHQRRRPHQGDDERLAGGLRGVAAQQGALLALRAQLGLV